MANILVCITHRTYSGTSDLFVGENWICFFFHYPENRFKRAHHTVCIFRSLLSITCIWPCELLLRYARQNDVEPNIKNTRAQHEWRVTDDSKHGYSKSKSPVANYRNAYLRLKISLPFYVFFLNCVWNFGRATCKHAGKPVQTVLHTSRAKY